MLSVRHVLVMVGPPPRCSLVCPSIDVLPGEVVAVVGPNDAGKAVLLRVLCDDLAPTVGAMRCA